MKSGIMGKKRKKPSFAPLSPLFNIKMDKSEQNRTDLGLKAKSLVKTEISIPKRRRTDSTSTLVEKKSKSSPNVSLLPSGRRRVAGQPTQTLTQVFIDKEVRGMSEDTFHASPFAFIQRVVKGEPGIENEFIYLKDRSCAYDLVQIPASEVDPKEHYTLSSRGLITVKNGEVTFTPIFQWEREFYLFRTLMVIPFFRKYRIWKSFLYWKTAIRRAKAHLCQSKLSKQLFILNDDLRFPLFDIRKLCWELFSAIKLFKIDMKNTYTLIQFISAQEEQRVVVKSMLTSTVRDIKKLVVDACNKRTQSFLIQNGFRSKDGGESMRKKNSTLAEDTSGEMKTSHAEKAAVRTECRWLTKFITIVDCFIRDTLMSIALDRTRKLLKSVSNLPENMDEQLQMITSQQKSKKKSRKNVTSVTMFTLDLSLSDKSTLIFSPELWAFQDGLRDAIYDGMKVLLDFERLILDEDCQKFIVSNTEEENELDLESVVLQDVSFNKDVFQINEGLSKAFGLAMQYVESLEKYRLIYLEKTMEQTFFEEANRDDFDNLLRKYTKQIEIFNEIPLSNDIGIIRVDSGKLKDLFLPIPRKRLKRIQETLPVECMRRMKNLTSYYSKSNENIMRTPATVEEFVTFKQNLQCCHDKEVETEDTYEEVTELFQLVGEHKIKTLKIFGRIYDEMSQARSTLKTNVNISDSSIDDSTQKFSRQMKTAVPELQKQMKQIHEDMKDRRLENDVEHLDDMVAFVKECDSKLTEYEDLSVKYQYYQPLLGMQVSEYDDLDEIREDLNVKRDLWVSLHEWVGKTTGWMTAAMTDIDTETVNNEIKKYTKVAMRCGRTLGETKAVLKLKELVDQFKETMPIVDNLGSSALLDRHWGQITELIGYDIPADKEFTLGKIIENNIFVHQEAIAEIATQAAQEMALVELLKKVTDMWEGCDFTVQSYKEQKDVFILTALDDIIANLDESLVTINTINGSRYVGPIREEVTEWNKKLVLFQETLDEWISLQKKWMYLENIFSGGDIAKQMPKETAVFQQVDASWKKMMQVTWDNPDAVTAGTFQGRRETLISHNAALDKIEKSLEDYLETKRQIFPRFYFLSNDELLEILAESKNPQKVQPHLRKCFDNIVKLELLEDKSHSIKSMFSSEGENVPLGKNLKAGRKQVEEWLGFLEADMRKTLRTLMKGGVEDYERQSRKDWIMQHFSQIVMTVSQIEWCRGCETALRESNPVAALKDWYDVNLGQIDDLMDLVRGKLKKIDRKKIVALVTTDVHSRDVIKRLIDADTKGISDFNWQQQLRFYWDLDIDDCCVRQVQATFRYGYEYMGVASRLVITPLTDRCWITVLGAMHIKLGASPAGPAGTGKTESVKDLAKGLGIQCVVFNCSDQIDYKMMGKLFSGLAQTGSWTCLDEFNRIQIEVLSVVAQQLLSVRQALLRGASKFDFEGKHIPLKDRFGVNVTMNPGYAGRTELPDNLKVLFRPVAMMIPDYGLIAEIMLFAEGFGNATPLSRKMVKLYKLASEQLSQQDHYDFGMRAVKSVLVMAGALKRSEPDLAEDVVLIRAMRDSNVPKFLTDDLILFNAIVSDLFPSLEIPDQDYGILQTTIENMLTEDGYQLVPITIMKTIQLFDTFNVRFGVMIVGPTGGGKTVVYKTLAKAMIKLSEELVDDERFEIVHQHILNPKCITMGELYGEVNVVTQEWTDGLASTIMRTAIKDETDDRHWVVFDGPVDALWIENMNTVLDDNMTLCLANGERIKLKPELRMLFEVADLSVASPATVSRCGMVYLAPEDLGPQPVVKTFVYSEVTENFPEQMSLELRQVLIAMFEEHFDECVTQMRSLCKEAIEQTDVALATTMCMFLKSLFNTRNVDFSADFKLLKSLMSKTFLFSLIWALGGSVISGRDEFAQFICNRFDELKIPFGQAFSYTINFAKNEWALWSSYVEDFVFLPGVSFAQLMVPTIDTCRFGFMLETLMYVNHSPFYTGPSGVGKTCMIQTMMNEKFVKEQNYHAIIVNFSAQTNARRTQGVIEKKLQKRTKTSFGGPAGRKVILYVDDINMPEPEFYGAQPPIELLRQFQDFKGFYDREKLFWKNIVDTTLLISAAPPGGGRNKLTPRFTRHFSVLCMMEPSVEVMTRIFDSIFGGFLTHYKFNSDLRPKLKSTVESTIQMFLDITASLLPIPAKAHYTYNLRDISKVFQGMMMVTPKAVTDVETLTKLWIHESSRCFHDRLINEEDRSWFNDRIVVFVNSKFGMNMTEEDIFKEDIIFGDFFKAGSKEYTKAPQLDAVVKTLENYLDDYNASNSTPMNLVFFRDAVLHVSRILRILRQPRGNALLVGVGGSGRQSLSRLAASISDYECKQIELRRGYDYQMFRDDLKELLILAGGKGKHTVFLLTDTQIIDERMLEDVNNILNAGEVPNLFEQEDINMVNDLMTPVMKEANIPITPDNIWQQFVLRCRERLHVVLCMSPVGDAFRIRCRMFPSLINCTTINWFDKWPREALMSVSTRYLSELDLPSTEVREGLATMCVEIHTSVEEMSEKFFAELTRKVYTTPKSYLDLITLYTNLLGVQTEIIEKRKRTLSTGLAKLLDTNKTVAELQEILTKLGPELKVKQKETTELLETVAKDQAEADKVKAVVEKDTKIVEKQAEETGIVQKDAQADLDRALPALKAANTALATLNKSDITEVKNMGSPPSGVVMVLETVCILLKEKIDWTNAKKVMSQGNFLKTLQDFDKDNIPHKTVQKLKKKYTSNPEFSIEKMSSVSVAATTLCKWVHAMVVYSEVVKEVEPKRKKLAEMNTLLSDSNAKLKKQKDALQEVIDKVNNLKKKCNETMAQKRDLEFQAEQTKQRLVRAEKLTVGLADEAVRWAEQDKILAKQISALVGDVFLSAGSVSYAGPFTGQYRIALMNSWIEKCKEREIPMSDEFSMIKCLGTPLVIKNWNSNGLPSDDVSVEGAIMVARAERWPLMIDPQNQAKMWIKNMESDNKLRITKLDNPNLLRVLEAGIRNGCPVLIEDIQESLDPALDPILLKAVYKQGGRKLIRLGDSEIDYDPKFKFFITTKLPNPHYLPEICIKITLINFTVTKEGLAQQLLGDVVKQERPDVEEKLSTLIKQMAKDNKEIAEIEDKILQLLSESTGNILDDEVLIETLESSKFTSSIINERMIEAKTTEKVIQETRVQYVDVAKRGSIIYFCVADLALVDPMYQYSLSYFQKLFISCIQKSEKQNTIEERLNVLNRNITLWVYINVCRGLFEKHKLMFSFLITANILLDSGEIDRDEWMFFLRGGGMVNAEEIPMNPDESVFLPRQWSELYSLQQFDAFSNICADITLNLPSWIVYKNEVEPHKADLPDRYDELTQFQKMMILCILRREKIVFALSDFVSNSLSKDYVTVPPTRLIDVYEDSDKMTPIIFILSVGADPTTMLLRIAKDLDKSKELAVISLGQGQGLKAEKLIASAVRKGGWVCLQNCHLAKSWMPSLEKIVSSNSDDPDPIHDNFRLWLTSMPCTYFPVPVLQNGAKLTTEPPKGLRANLTRSYGSIESEEFEGCTKPKPWKKLLFGLSFFHAIVQERRKFGALGFNIRYEFNDSDLETSTTMLRMFMDEQEDIPWDAMTYVIGQINYGGRVTDDWDRRCLMSILGLYYTPEVLSDTYVFSWTGTYRAPPEGPLQDYKKYIDQLPLIDVPEVFGMHENANITFQTQETNAILTVILSIQPRAVGGGEGKSVEETVTELATELSTIMPEDLNKDEAGDTTFIYREGVMDSLSTVLLQEIERFNKLLIVIRESLINLCKAIVGEVVMSGELDEVFSAMVNNKVPELWKSVAYPSLKPLGSWFQDLLMRVEFMQGWLLDGQPNAFPISAFFFPQGFMTGTLQNHSRKYKLPIDQLNFRFTILEYYEGSAFKQPPKDGVYVYGLFIDGGKWDQALKELDDANVGTLYSKLPGVWFEPEQHHELGAGLYECPLYKTSVRAGALSTTGQSTNFVLALELPSQKPAKHWILQGTALLCQLDD